MTPSAFWDQLDQHTCNLAQWNGEVPLPCDLSDACSRLCDTLRHPDARREMADPRNMLKVKEFRAKHADKWSLFNSVLEYEMAETLEKNCRTFADFREQARAYWLTRESADLVDAEMAMLARQNLSFTGLKVCMIGPGALPYTGLELANLGAHVTLVDMYGPACAWSLRWMERFFAQQPWQVIQRPGQELTYADYDLVVVASMLFGRADVLAAINAAPPRHVLVRSTSGRRPMSLLLPQVPPEELANLGSATFVDESHPPLHVGNIAFLYSYPPAAQGLAKQAA